MGPARRLPVPRRSLTGAFGAVTGWIWGLVVTDLQAGQHPG